MKLDMSMPRSRTGGFAAVASRSTATCSTSL
jgi:hypothetical protein